MKLYILNGPNLNFLGIREPDHYGSTTYEGLLAMIRDHATEIGATVVCRQSNHEGDLVDWIQEAYFEKADGIVINPGAYTHTSIALLDAVKSVSIPTVEVHISRVEEREDFRKISYLRPACVATVSGRGVRGYLDAMDLLLKQGGPSECK
ncbi:MAG: type II 3-dehydroquinate dehydratase [Clostridia bacterium]|nr:type II 3-dehydroquinate dehydratase [Clostridia bacterium]